MQIVVYSDYKCFYCCTRCRTYNWEKPKISISCIRDQHARLKVFTLYKETIDEEVKKSDW